MTILLFAIIIIIVVALLVWAIDYLKLQSPPANLIKFLVIAVGALLILNQAGII